MHYEDVFEVFFEPQVNEVILWTNSGEDYLLAVGVRKILLE